MAKQGIALVTAIIGPFIGTFLGACGGGERPDGVVDAKRDTDVVIPSSRLTCQGQPGSGEACDPLPDGLFCRQHSCTGGCEQECRCKEGTWNCSVVCRDYFSPIPVDCGTPPLCLDVCQTATVLPDGGIVATDATYTIGYQYRIQFTPPDMTTLWGEQKLRIALGAGPPLDATWLQDLAARISVRSWPDMEEVPAINTVEARASSSDVGAISIVPNATLADRWYVLRLSAPPFWMASPNTHVAADGSYVARFRTGSEPKVAAVTFAGGPSKRRLYIDLSEPVIAKQSPTEIVSVRYAGTQATCTDVAFVADKPMPTLSFDCLSLAAFPDQIAIGAGMVSTTGVAFAPVTIDKSSLTLGSCGESCQLGHAP